MSCIVGVFFGIPDKQSQYSRFIMNSGDGFRELDGVNLNCAHVVNGQANRTVPACGIFRYGHP